MIENSIRNLLCLFSQPKWEITRSSTSRFETFPVNCLTLYSNQENSKFIVFIFPFPFLLFKNKSICCLFYREHSNKERVGLSKENLLLRGCTIRNTEAVMGIVVYAGWLPF